MNEKKSFALGIPHGTACNKLRKNIMFQLVRVCGLDNCYRCGGLIKSTDEFSIEHKEPWEGADDPIDSFMSISNIAFSHISCNIGDTVKNNSVGEDSAASKLSKSEALKIKSSKEKTKVLANSHNVSTSQIRRIRAGTRWGHLNKGDLV